MGERGVIYDVNVNRIKEQLSHLELCADLLERLAVGKRELEERFAAERALHLASECMIDVGSVMIDGFIMRDPGGYFDIVDILEDERVIDRETGSKLRNLLSLRERLVRRYTETAWTDLIPYVQDSGWFADFAKQVKTYLQKELGEQSIR
nr:MULTISPECIES: HepT-like ribonuclease domain-containing protein [unclassified Thermoactinomyces]